MVVNNPCKVAGKGGETTMVVTMCAFCLFFLRIPDTSSSMLLCLPCSWFQENCNTPRYRTPQATPLSNYERNPFVACWQKFRGVFQRCAETTLEWWIYQHLPVGVPSLNQKGWWIDKSALEPWKAPKLKGPGMCFLPDLRPERIRPLKRDHLKRKFHRTQPSIFRGELLSFLGGRLHTTCD